MADRAPNPRSRPVRHPPSRSPRGEVFATLSRDRARTRSMACRATHWRRLGIARRPRVRNTMPVILVTIATVTSACTKHEAPPPSPAPEVYVVPVVQKDVPVYLDLVGQTEGSQDVEIRARVEGFLESM